MSNETKKQELLTVLNGMSDEEQASVLVDLVSETLARLPRLQHEETEEPEEKKHYYGLTCIEECDERAAAYEETPGGRIFKRRLENALDFVYKAHSCNITCVQVGYMADKCYNSFLNGSFELYALGFKSGADYQKRKAKARAKK